MIFYYLLREKNSKDVRKTWETIHLSFWRNQVRGFKSSGIHDHPIDSTHSLEFEADSNSRTRITQLIELLKEKMRMGILEPSNVRSLLETMVCSPMKDGQFSIGRATTFFSASSLLNGLVYTLHTFEATRIDYHHDDRTTWPLPQIVNTYLVTNNICNWGCLARGKRGLGRGCCQSINTQSEI